jgi:hypothetical protein
MENSTKGVLVASAVAALFIACGGNQAGPAAPTPGEMAGKVKCVGINECAKKGACAQEGHACGGKNECAKKGITLASAEDCKGKGGTAL